MDGQERLRPAPRVLHRRVGADSVLLDVASGRYFELNPTGTRVWELLAQGPTRTELVAVLEAEFEADAGELAADLESLLGELLDRGLLERA